MPALHEIYDLTVRAQTLHSGTQRVTPSPNYLDSDHSGLIIPSPPLYIVAPFAGMLMALNADSYADTICRTGY